MKTLRAYVTLFFSIFFQLSFFEKKFVPSQLYLFIKGLIFGIIYVFSDFFMIQCDCHFIPKTFGIFLLIVFVVAFSFFVRLGEPAYDPWQFAFIL